MVCSPLDPCTALASSVLSACAEISISALLDCVEVSSSILLVCVSFSFLSFPSLMPLESTSVEALGLLCGLAGAGVFFFGAPQCWTGVFTDDGDTVVLEFDASFVLASLSGAPCDEDKLLNVGLSELLNVMISELLDVVTSEWLNVGLSEVLNVVISELLDVGLSVSCVALLLLFLG